MNSILIVINISIICIPYFIHTCIAHIYVRIGIFQIQRLKLYNICASVHECHNIYILCMSQIVYIGALYKHGMQCTAYILNAAKYHKCKSMVFNVYMHSTHTLHKHRWSNSWCMWLRCMSHIYVHHWRCSSGLERIWAKRCTVTVWWASMTWWN